MGIGTASDSSLSDFNRRMMAYQVSGRAPSTILLGASYAAQLSIDDPGIHNLGMVGSYPSEHAAILRYVRQRDRVIYFVSVREITYRAETLRPELINPLLRPFHIAKLYLWGEPSKAKLLQSYVRNMAVLKAAMIATTCKPSDLSRFHAMHQEHPNILFVLTPVRNDDDLSHAYTAFQQAMMRSGLPVLDLSRSVADSHFVDFLHLNNEGRQIVLAATERHRISSLQQH
jgi:hypothetical protein